MKEVNYAITFQVNSKRIMVSRIVGEIEIRSTRDLEGLVEHLAWAAMREAAEPFQRMILEEITLISENTKEGGPDAQ